MLRRLLGKVEDGRYGRALAGLPPSCRHTRLLSPGTPAPRTSWHTRKAYRPQVGGVAAPGKGAAAAAPVKQH